MIDIPWYQTIPEVGIKGRMNTPEEFDKIGLSKVLTGMSVLDVGCNTGAFMIECARRGARVVDGVEPDNTWRWLARGILSETIGTANGNPATSVPYHLYSDIPVYGDYDLTLLLSITHLVDHPQELFDRVWERTKGMMILEINDRLQEDKEFIMPIDAKLFGKNKDNRSVWHIYR